MNKSRLIEKLRNEINTEIKNTLKKFCDVPLSEEMMGYQIGLSKSKEVQGKPLNHSITQVQGKRFRPILCLLSSMAISGNYKKALPAAAAIELIHNFSLIHDDIQDEDQYRRGRMTVWKKWDKNQAINAGDAMHTLSNLALNRLFELGLSSENIFSVVNSACYKMCEGQMLDCSFEKRKTVSINEYMKMISKKTAALIESATHAGALTATKSQNTIKHFKNFGFNLGMAFQIFNDISGFDGTGVKFTHFKSDIEKSKKSLPIILAIKNAGKSDINPKKMFEAIKKSGAIEKSRKIGERYLEKALQELNGTGIKNEVMQLLKQYVLEIRKA